MEKAETWEANEEIECGKRRFGVRMRRFNMGSGELGGKCGDWARVSGDY
ncbi:hypothetical protein [Bacillus sp. JCM 19041]